MQVFESRNQRSEMSGWESNETLTCTAGMHLISLLFYQISPASFDG